MIVAQILKLKGSNAVETVKPEARLADAAATLSTRRIGALIVSPDGRKVAGVLSERDIIRVLGGEGPGCLDRPVDSVMTATVTTCTLEDSAESVLERMTVGRFRHMPVMVDGALAGVISIGDVVKARIDEIEHENAALSDMIKGF